MNISRYTLCLALLIISCENLVEIDPPRTDLTRKSVFQSDATANAAMLDIYFQISSIEGMGGVLNSISFFGTLSSDESRNLVTFSTAFQAISDNALLPDNSQVLRLWSDLYLCIYKTNAILEGLESSSGVTTALKDQLTGEAKFIRAFCHFYLTNFFGDVPIVLSTDYLKNQNIARSPQSLVYEQIFADLTDAQDLLTEDYSFSKGERTRANRDVATAMLARAYLYAGNWSAAESESSKLIAKESVFSLPPLEDVFKKASPEAILHFPPPTGVVFDRTIARSYSRLQPELLAAFETNDNRRTTWTTTASRADKYKSGDASFSEYAMVMRLAEQYLIRAEARAHLDKLTEAQEDINKIRNRAGLTNTSAADQQALLLAIEHERRMELFLEWGHRWFDLKRLNRANEILGALKPDWQATDVLYPIPEAQLLRDLAMKDQQNPGY